jgi:outer membrane autotransporter protein
MAWSLSLHEQWDDIDSWRRVVNNCLRGGTEQLCHRHTGNRLGGYLYNGGGILNNDGALNNSGEVICFGNCYHNAGATYSGNGTIIIQGTLNNSSNNAFAIETLQFNSGSFINNGTGALSIGTVYIQYPAYSGTIQGNAISLTTANVEGPLAISSVITGAGSLTKTGAGTLTLSGANTYLGASIINAGMVSVGSDGNRGNAAGTLTFGGGTLLTTNSFTSNRSVTLNAGGGTFDTSGNSLTLSGNMTGSGSLTKTGAGTLILTGTSTYTGTTTIDAGSLSVNGSITSPVTVGAAGTLMGSGTITGNTVNSGTLAPGNSIGTLTIVGDYTQNAGSTYQVEVNSAGQSDRLVVTGTATINGGTVSVLAESGNYNMSTLYTILTAAGGVTGTYTGVTSNLAFLDPSLSYDANDVYLTLTRNTTNFADVAATPNQYAVASSLDHTSPYAQGDMSEIMNNLLSLSAQGARSAYNRMGGLSHISLAEATSFSIHRYVNTLSGRMAGFNTGGMSLADTGNILLAFNEDTGSDAGNVLVAAISNIKGKDASPWGLWARGYGNKGERLGDDISTKYDYHGGGLLIGFDKKMGERLLLGGAAGYSYTKVDLNGLNEEGYVASYQGSLYGAYNIDPWYVNGLIAYSYNRYDTTRNIMFGNITRTARADYSGHSLGGYVETGYQIKTEAVNIIPLASVQASSLRRNSFTEKHAGALDLSADSNRMSSFIGSLGVKLRREHRIQNGSITPEVRVRWLHEFGDNDYTLNAAFAGYPTSVFSVRGDRAQRDSAAVGVGLNWEIGKSFGFALAYDAIFAGDHTEHGGTAGIRYRW